MIKKLDSKMNCIEISVLGAKKAECLDFEDAKTMGRKINELIDAVNKLQESVQGVVDNSIKDGAYIQALEDQVNEIKQYLDWDEISMEDPAENSKDAPELYSIVKDWENEHFADVSKKIKRAADSANKNLDNALEVAVQSLKNIKAFYEESYADPHTFVNWDAVAQRLANEADDALTQISIILKITKGGKDE